MSAFGFLAIELSLKAGWLEPSWHVLNGLGRHRLQATLIASHSLLRLLCVGGGLWAWNTLPSALMGLIVATGVSSLLVAVVSDDRERSGIVTATDTGLRELLLPWLRFSLLVDALNQVLAFAGLWMLTGVTADSPMGGYAACQMLVQPLLPLGLVLSRAAFAPFARAIADSRGPDAAHILAECTRWAALFIGLGFLVAQQHGRFLLALLFGHQLASEGDLLGRLFLGMSGIAITCFFCDMMAAGYWLRRRCQVMVGVACVSLPVVYMLVRWSGATGAASGTLITGMLGVLIAGGVLSRVVGAFVPWRELCHAALSAAIASAAETLLFPHNGKLAEVSALVLLVSCYVVVVGLMSRLIAPRVPSNPEMQP